MKLRVTLSGFIFGFSQIHSCLLRGRGNNYRSTLRNLSFFRSLAANVLWSLGRRGISNDILNLRVGDVTLRRQAIANLYERTGMITNSLYQSGDPNCDRGLGDDP
jgi:hypothetical protein